MRDHRYHRVLAALLLAACAGIARGDTNTYETPASVCQPAYNTSAQTAYGEPGIGNFSSTAEARIFCPVGRAEMRNLVWPTTKVSWGAVRYVDNNSSVPFWCYMWLMENSGATYWSGSKYTCSAPYGGCFDSTSEYIGINTLSWSNPFGDQFFNDPTVGYSCYIPREENGRASWVTSLQTYTQPSQGFGY